jgi:glucose-6-phosphate isomerase
LRLGDILFDCSKNRITVETLSLLIALARQASLAQKVGQFSQVPNRGRAFA